MRELHMHEQERGCAGEERNEAEIIKAYRDVMKEHCHGSFDRSKKGAYMYEVAKLADSIHAASSRPRQKRIMKEMRALQVPNAMAMDGGASILIRSDEERIDVVLALSFIAAFLNTRSCPACYACGLVAAKFATLFDPFLEPGVCWRWWAWFNSLCPITSGASDVCFLHGALCSTGQYLSRILLRYSGQSYEQRS
jgi:hypothetical protein